jgi:hypothetical protein
VGLTTRQRRKKVLQHYKLPEKKGRETLSQTTKEILEHLPVLLKRKVRVGFREEPK